MGKLLVIKGADFSAVAVTQVIPIGGGAVTTTNRALLTDEKYYKVVNGALSEYDGEGWASKLIPVHSNLEVESLVGTISEGASGNIIPAIIFLSGNSITNFMNGSELYGTAISASPGFAKVSGQITIPSGATHMILQTVRTNPPGDLDAEISWDDTEN